MINVRRFCVAKVFEEFSKKINANDERVRGIAAIFSLILFFFRLAHDLHN